MDIRQQMFLPVQIAISSSSWIYLYESRVGNVPVGKDPPPGQLILSLFLSYSLSLFLRPKLFRSRHRRARKRAFAVSSVFFVTPKGPRVSSNYLRFSFSWDWHRVTMSLPSPLSFSFSFSYRSSSLSFSCFWQIRRL